MVTKKSGFNPQKSAHELGVETRQVPVDDVDVRAQAKTWLKSAAGVVGNRKLPGYEHSGSVAVHFYYSNLAGTPAIVHQVDLGGTSEWVSAKGLNELFHKMREFYGHNMNRNHYKGGDGKIQQEQRREARAKIAEQKSNHKDK